jgi:hypothetical protein
MTQIGETASKSKRAIVDFFRGNVAVSTYTAIASVAVLMFVTAILTVVILQLRAANRVQTELLRLQHDVLEESKKREVEREVMIKSLIALEEIVFEPKVKSSNTTTTTIVRVPLVRLERQVQEMREQLTSLQRRLLEHQRIYH